ncbi:MAG: hypothetical protein U0360_07130 [Dehalococcoidia bacterium]
MAFVVAGKACCCWTTRPGRHAAFDVARRETTIDEFYRSVSIINGYLLGYIAVLPARRRIADVYGHARVYAASSPCSSSAPCSSRARMDSAGSSPRGRSRPAAARSTSS